MSAYLNVQIAYADDPRVAELMTNLSLAPDGEERYHSPAEGKHGSRLARALFGVDGVQGLCLSNGTLTVTRNIHVEWHVIIPEITAVLKDFFL